MLALAMSLSFAPALAEGVPARFAFEREIAAFAPSLATATAAHAFATDHYRWISQQTWMAGYPEYCWGRWQFEAEWCADAWRHLCGAANPNYSFYWRRRSLDMLRDQIGKELFAGGIMPPPAPYWRFWEG